MRSRRTRSLTACVWTAAVACALAATVACQAPLAMGADGDPKPKDAAKKLDDALLDDLDNELLEGVGDLKKPAAKAAPAPQPGEESPTAPDEGEDVAMPDPEKDPLGHISRQMRQAERLIPERGKRTDAEAVQRRIVDDLARLIEEAERQRAQQQASKSSRQQSSGKRQTVQQPKSSQGSAADQNANKPASDSTDRLGKAETAKPDPELFKGLLKDSWGHLPERERELMMQMSRERFLPQYELLIERYYRRLAEERSK